jgi:hypothetical protein
VYTGRVLGSEAFPKRLERKLRRGLRRRKPGPKAKPNQCLRVVSRYLDLEAEAIASRFLVIVMNQVEEK